MPNKLDRFFVNMQFESVEFFINMMQIMFGVWLIAVQRRPPFVTVLSHISALWTWGFAMIALSIFCITCQYYKITYLRKVLTFFNFCLWVFITIKAFNSLAYVPPFGFGFTFALGWIYLKLVRSPAEP